MEGLGSLDEDLGELPDAERSYRKALELLRKLDDRGEVARTLVSLGAILARGRRPEEARPYLTASQAIACEVGSPGPLVLASCSLALLPGGAAAAATDAFAADEGRLRHDDKMQARFLLWQATSDSARLTEAHRLLEFARDHAPEEYRDTMIEIVPLHRDIVAAWKGRDA